MLQAPMVSYVTGQMIETMQLVQETFDTSDALFIYIVTSPDASSLARRAEFKQHVDDSVALIKRSVQMCVDKYTVEREFVEHLFNETVGNGGDGGPTLLGDYLEYDPEVSGDPETSGDPDDTKGGGRVAPIGFGDLQAELATLMLQTNSQRDTQMSHLLKILRVATFRCKRMIDRMKTIPDEIGRLIHMSHVANDKGMDLADMCLKFGGPELVARLNYLVRRHAAATIDTPDV